MFKYPPIIDEEKKVTISAKLPERYKDLMLKLGNGNFNAGIYIVLFTMEEKIKKYLDKKNKNKKNQA